MKTMSRPARHCTRFGMAALLALAGAVAQPALAAERCPANDPAARSAAFDVDALFARGGTTLTPSGQVRLARFAQALEQSDIEVVVISVPQPQGVAAEAWRTMSRQRAEAVREHLVGLGLAPQRVYTEQRSAPSMPADRQEMASAPLVIEAVAAWPGALAGLRGPTCVVQALPLRAPARTVVA
jgi:type IV pilus biogenesis protein CpaD/CtpE